MLKRAQGPPWLMHPLSCQVARAADAEPLQANQRVFFVKARAGPSTAAARPDTACVSAAYVATLPDLPLMCTRMLPGCS